MSYILETERLSLRKFILKDASFIVELVNSPGWIEFIGDRNIRTEEDAKAYLESGPLKSYEQNGFGLSMVELRNAKTSIGMCGILKRDNLEQPEIGFAFLPAFTSKGFAFEMANAVMTYARQKLSLPVVSAIVVPNNGASIRLLEKIGMKFIKSFSFPGENEVLWFYSI